MAKLNTSSLLEISPERQKLMVEDRQKLTQAIEEMKILLPTNPAMQTTIDQAQRTLDQLDALFTIIVKRNPAAKPPTTK